MIIVGSIGSDVSGPLARLIRTFGSTEIGSGPFRGLPA
jgi:hypothetical protein